MRSSKKTMNFLKLLGPDKPFPHKRAASVVELGSDDVDGEWSSPKVDDVDEVKICTWCRRLHQDGRRLDLSGDPDDLVQLTIAICPDCRAKLM
jgi:hypothetical protein